MRRLLVVTLFAAVCAASVNAKPNFAGTWEVDSKASDFSKSRPITAMTEVIVHKEPNVTVDRILKYKEGESRQLWKLRTDGSEQWQVIPEGSVSARTRWDGDKLITEAYDDSGKQVMREVRELDSQGRMIVTTTYEDDEGPGHARAVFVKRSN